MTNLQSLLDGAKGLQVVARTTVWDFHNCDHLDNLAKKPNTNIGKLVADLKSKGEKGAFTLFVDQIGRSAHSASRVVVLRGITNVNEIGSFYYSKRLGEVFIK